MGDQLQLMVKVMFLLTKDSGFTLVSMLITFVIVCSLVYFGLIFSVERVHSTERKTAGQQLVTYVHLAKDCGITSGLHSELTIGESSITFSCNHITRSKQFKYVSFKTNFPQNKVVFNNLGHIQSAGTIEVCTSSCDTYTLSVGSGDINEKE